MSTRLKVLGLAATLAMGAAAHADPAGTSFCAQLSTESAPVCVPAERGPHPAWEQAAAKWRPGPIPSAPLVAVWAAPGLSLDDLVHNREALVTYTDQVKIAMKYAEQLNAESLLTSLKRQKELLDAIKARQGGS